MIFITHNWFIPNILITHNWFIPNILITHNWFIPNILNLQKLNFVEVNKSINTETE